MWELVFILAASVAARGDDRAACAAATHHCFELGGPGCDDLQCCLAVCDVDLTCCANQWDGDCVALAYLLCTVGTCAVPCPSGSALEAEPCGSSTNSGCDTPPSSGSNCCIPNGSVTCDDPECLGAVCSIDPFCCMVAWDQICADEAILLCPELCSPGFSPSTALALNQSICGGIWAEAGERDVDWYQVTLTGITQVTVTLTSNTPMQLGIADTDGIAECNVPVQLEPFVSTLPCSTTNLSACLEAGQHWIVVRPVLDDGLVCGTADTRYVLKVTPSAPTCTLPDPVNDVCDDATEIFEGSTAVSTHDAATDGPALPPECASSFSDTVDKDVWFRYVATRSGTLRVGTCGTCTLKARLAVYAGSCAALEFMGCNDKGFMCEFADPHMDFDVELGSQYFLRFGSNFNEDGEATLSLSYLPCEAQYIVELVPQPGTIQATTATAISEDGELAGNAGTTHSLYGAFRWSPQAGYAAIASPFGTLMIWELNDAGTAVASTNQQAFVATANTFVTLPGLPGCTGGIAHGINEAGTIVGSIFGSSCQQFAVQWSGGAPIALPVPSNAKSGVDINDAGAICGTGNVAGFSSLKRGWLLADGQFTWISPPSVSADLEPAAMNNSGTIVGYYEVLEDSPPMTLAAFCWTNGVLKELVPPAGYESGVAADINNSGDIVGTWYWSPSSFQKPPFLLRAGGNSVFINDLIGRYAGMTVHAVRALNDAGQIAADVRDEGLVSAHAARLTPRPPTGDLNCDGLVDGADLAIVLASWGPCMVNVSCNADFTLDGKVDGADLAVVLGGWGVVRTR